jgi:hypothetical protein
VTYGDQANHLCARSRCGGGVTRRCRCPRGRRRGLPAVSKGRSANSRQNPV